MPSKQRIISLLPAATEIVCELGFGDCLVGVSDDCDYPSFVKKILKVTSSSINNLFSSLEIDLKVKESKHQGKSVFHLQKEVIKKLDPTLIFTQELCPVCAPTFCDVLDVSQSLGIKAKIISQEPHTFDDIFLEIKKISKILNAKVDVLKSYKKRLSNVQRRLNKTSNLIPSVMIIEWLEPIMLAGHWVPEMVELAGGYMLKVKKGEKSEYVSWEEVYQLNPDVLILAPCGFDIKRTLKELSLITSKDGFGELKAVLNKKVFLIDGNAYLTRPGPRIVDGVEILSEILHPAVFLRKHTKKDWVNL